MSFKESFQPGFAILHWNNWQPQKYAHVEFSENDMAIGVKESEPSVAGPLRRIRTSKRPILIYIVLFWAILSTGLLVASSISSYHKNRRSPSLNAETDSAILLSPCGKTPAEARAANCVFDMMAFSWLPPRCHDAELTEEFKQMKDWGYWLDRKRTRPIDQNLALTGEYPELYTEFEYHLTHCTFLWKKMHRALLSSEGKLAIDSVTAGYAHTEHCSKMLMTERNVALDAMNSLIVVKYPDCGMA